ncbi:unnamed protein product [Ixodes pacificus]
MFFFPQGQIFWKVRDSVVSQVENSIETNKKKGNRSIGD